MSGANAKSDDGDGIDKIFDDVVRRRFPVSNNVGAARTWVPRDSDDPAQFVPRPDRSLGTARLLSLLGGFAGLDHFYLRSPITGAVKFLTFGGFLLWWLWDVAQLWFSEERRLMNYGLSTPLDAAAGIAQGMITNEKTEYEERASYFTWSLTALLGGFAGLDYLVLGKPWQFINLLISAIFVIGYLSFITSMTSWTDLISFRGIMSLIVLATLGVGVFSVWVTKIQALMNPRGLIRSGIEMTDNTDKTLNWFMKLVSDKNGQPAEGYEDDYDVLKHYYSITHIVGKQFEIGHSTGVQPPPDPTPIGFPPATIVKVMGKQVYTAVIEPLLYLIPGYAEKQALQKAAMAAIKGKGLVEGLGGKLLERSGLGRQAEGLMSDVKGAIGQAKGIADQTKGFSAESLLGKAVEGSGLGDQMKRLSQTGGGELSTESKITGAVVLAILVGGTMKGIVDYLVE